MPAVEMYAMLQQFPAALKLLDRALDITSNDLDIMATKANIYQAQGKLPEAARLLSGVNEQTPNGPTFSIKVNQLQYERNYGEAIRLLRARLTQFHYASENDKGNNQVALAYTQLFAGDTTGAKVTAEQARNTFEKLYRDQQDNPFAALALSQTYGAMGQKDSALKAAERAVTLMPRAEEPALGPGFEENLAAMQALFSENSRAIATLTELLQTPYFSWLYLPAPVTPALLKLDPEWDPLRGDPAFQKLCQEKQP
jgi:tetratricopeptide (TPR) repeat protein